MMHRQIVSWLTLIGGLLFLGTACNSPDSSSDSDVWEIVKISAVPKPSKSPYPTAFAVFEIRKQSESLLIACKIFENRKPGIAYSLQVGDRIGIEKFEPFQAESKNMFDSIADFDSELFDPIGMTVVAVAERDSPTELQFGHRMPSPQFIAPDQRKVVASEFIAHHARKTKKWNGFVGDSQFFGYRLRDEEVCSYQLSAANELPFINLAVPSAQAEDSTWLIEECNRQGLEFEQLIYGFNILNFAEKIQGSELARYRDEGSLTPQELERIELLETATPLDPSNPGAGVIKISNKSKYLWNEAKRASLAQLCETLKTNSTRPVIVMQPHCMEALERAGFLEDFESSIDAATQVIESTGVEVVDLSDSIPESQFFDPVHLTKDGHVQLRQLLEPLL